MKHLGFQIETTRVRNAVTPLEYVELSAQLFTLSGGYGLRLSRKKIPEAVQPASVEHLHLR